VNRSIRSAQVLAAAIVAAAAAWPQAQIAQAGPAEPVVPSALAVPAGSKLFLVGHAVGVQIYSCDATSSGYRWDFVAPRADLYGDNGKSLATHFAGPTWQANDGSSVRGQVVDRVTVDATAVPWLLLSAASTAAGADGDRLTATTFIQRIATTGGLPPPAAACNDVTTGSTAEVPYTGDYYFWKAVGV
jgi:FtsP/CotA-like multicopper oxidase with cupredoxin domain